jgi:hypothetical protein
MKLKFECIFLRMWLDQANLTLVGVLGLKHLRFICKVLGISKCIGRT